MLDPDRGSSTVGTKLAEPVSIEEAARREDIRAGLRDLDAMTEAAAGLTRAQKDRDRIMPRATVGAIAHPRMERTLPDADQIRGTFSGRQMKARSKTKQAVLARLPQTQYVAMRNMLAEDGATWRRINDTLSEGSGDIDGLSERDLQTVKRVDRAIQAYERHNDRGHVVYANVSMPSYINRSNIVSYVQDAFQHGDEIAFDRYTGTSHALWDATDNIADPAGRVAVFEIQTRRGMYLGGSEGSTDASHLLPRGMHFRVVRTTQVTYNTPTGKTGTRMLIQLQDITPEPSGATRQ